VARRKWGEVVVGVSWRRKEGRTGVRGRSRLMGEGDGANSW